MSSPRSALVTGNGAENASAGFVSISDNQRRQLPEAKWIATIRHVPSHLFRASYSYDQGSYLAFLVPDRGEGPEDAIRIAEAVGMPLRIAAKIPRAETA